jgi:hypothetical protein
MMGARQDVNIWRDVPELALTAITLGGSNMKSFIRNALLGAAGLVALSLPAGAVSPTATTDSPVLKSSAEPIRMAQAARPYDPSAGSVGFKKKAKKKAKKKKAKK